jgi:hypothetical protein
MKYLLLLLVIATTSCNFKAGQVLIKGKKHQIILGVPGHTLKNLHPDPSVVQMLNIVQELNKQPSEDEENEDIVR